MQILEKPTDLIERIRPFEAFEGIKDSSLEWLIDKSDYKLFEKGDLILVPGAKADHMQVIVAGLYVIEIEQNGERQEITTVESGSVSGVLPFSRMTETRAIGTAYENTYILELHRSCFIEMVNIDYDLVQNLVGLMSSRIRDFTQLRLQNEKMMALGKLSAGLAHELNNPASAMVRSAQELHSKIHATPEKFKSILQMRITAEETDQINQILFSKVQAGINEDRSAIERSNMEDDILDWLDDQGVEDSDDIANTFTDYSFSVDDLEQVKTILGGRFMESILAWLESTLSLETLVGEIRESADRISTLVKSVKDYSHMDRSSGREAILVKEGIYSTLMILKHKVKKKQITLEKSFPEDLPKVIARVNELNQVWTNILDNALDALPEKGKLIIQASVVRQYVCVEIIDNGPGIPEEVISRIFDPFFTTKPIGEGTGMGLDITKKIIDRMKGQINVESIPGQTKFQIMIPAAAE